MKEIWRGNNRDYDIFNQEEKMEKNLFIFAWVTVSLFIFAAGAAAEKIGTETGNQAPDFQLKQMDGSTVSLSDFRGEIVFLNFWATWCPPCRKEMPDLQRFYEDIDAVVLGVNLTDTEISAHQVQQFLETFQISFPVVMDTAGEVSRLYQIRPIPTTYIIDSEGIIREKVYGEM